MGTTDEGHLLKNEKTALAKVMNKNATRRRVVLTGTVLTGTVLTPLQNSFMV